MRIIGNDPNTPRQTQVVASGTLSTGDTVIVNSDGTVSAVAETSVSETVGTPVEFYGGEAQEIGICFDTTNNKVVVAYKDGDNSSYGTAVVGTVSGTSISFGTPVVYNSATTTRNSAAFDESNGKVVVSYTDNGASSYGTAIVGTVSGTSISFGSEVRFNSANTQYIDSCYDSGNQKIIISYGNAGSSYAVTSIVGTVSGTSISFGTAADTGSYGYYTSNVYDPDSGKFLIGYSNSSSGNGEVYVGTVSGTSISYGSMATFQNSNTAEMSMAYDTVNQKVIIAYNNKANSLGSAIVGTISGTSITFGSAAHFSNAATSMLGIAYDENAQKFGIYYEDNSNNEYGTYVSGEVSGTSITFGSSSVLTTGITLWQNAVYDSNAQRLVGVYTNQGAGGAGTSVVVQNASTSINLTAENYIGTAKSGAADGDGVVVNTQGTVDDNQSSLTAGQSYYVQADGTLSTTAADPSVFAGTAVSSTKLIVKG